MKQIKSITDVTSDLNNNGLSVNVEVNRQLAARYGITPATIDNALYDALGSAHRLHHLQPVQPVPRGAGRQAREPSRICRRSATSICRPRPAAPGRCRLSGIADIKVTKSPLVISHLAQFPAVTVSFNLAPDASLEHGGG